MQSDYEWDFSGVQGVENVAVNSSSDCCDHCSAEMSCIFWTLAPTGTCYMSMNNNGSAPAANFISGQRSTFPSPFKKDVDLERIYTMHCVWLYT